MANEKSLKVLIVDDDKNICDLLRLYLEKDGSTAYSTTANLIADVSTSTCEGFNVPRAGFASGNYKIIINLASGDKTGRIEGSVSL